MLSSCSGTSVCGLPANGGHREGRGAIAGVLRVDVDAPEEDEDNIAFL